MSKVLSYLGLSKRAGKLVQGTDAVLKNLRSRQTHIIFVANDASIATIERVQKKGMFYNISVITNYSTTDLSQAVGENNIKDICYQNESYFVLTDNGTHTKVFVAKDNGESDVNQLEFNGKDWLQLEQGENTFNLTATSGAVNAYLNIIYKGRYE